MLYHVIPPSICHCLHPQPGAVTEVPWRAPRLPQRRGHAEPTRPLPRLGEGPRRGCRGAAPWPLEAQRRWGDPGERERLEGGRNGGFHTLDGWNPTKMAMGQYLLIHINTIFSGMNIHLPAILGFTRGTRVLKPNQNNGMFTTYQLGIWISEPSAVGFRTR